MTGIGAVYALELVEWRREVALPSPLRVTDGTAPRVDGEVANMAAQRSRLEATQVE
jgi:hypothetical protein